MATKGKSGFNRGQPPKAKLSAESIVEKIELEMLRAHRDAANNLKQYYEILNEYALGKQGSNTNQLSSLKYLIDMAKDYLDTQKVGGEKEVSQEDTTQQKANGTTGSSLISLNVVKKEDK